MPYVKSISIKTTVKKSIQYILNPDKTEGLLYASGINCVANADIAYNQFCDVYKQYNDVLYSGSSKGKKAPIKAHHFIQSFKEGQVTPELAHKIAEEWASKVFGDNRQIVIATHIDKGHIHNHFIVNSLDFDGKKYYGNKSTLQRARNISDEICKKYSLDIIVGNKRKGVHYKEWMEKQKGTSWKHNIRLAIDKAIIKVNNIDELLEALKSEGYEVKRGKYISIKPKDNDRYVRTRTLGEDYTEENLIKRINDKDKELPIIDDYNKNITKTKTQHIKPKYQGIQLKYISLIKLISNLIVNGKKPVRKYNHKKPYSKENDYDINVLAAQLRLLNKENITTENELNIKYNEVTNSYIEAKRSIDKLASLEESLNGVIANVKLYLEMSKINELTSAQKLKLSIAKSVIEKYNISSESDLIKLQNERIKTVEKIQKLKDSFSETEKRYMAFRDLMKIHEQIKNDTYMKNILTYKKEKEIEL